MFRIPAPPLRTAFAAALALSLAATFTPPARALSVAEDLKTRDATLYSGYFDLAMSFYGPRDKKGAPSSIESYQANVLFARPDRFRMVVRPGAKDEYRAVAEAGIVRWLDLATGQSGKDTIDKLVDPLAIALLGAAGELTRHMDLKDRPVGKQDTLVAADLHSRTWGSGVDTGRAWYDDAGRPVGFEFLLDDGTRVHLVILRFVPNPKTSSKDFEL